MLDAETGSRPEVYRQFLGRELPSRQRRHIFCFARRHRSGHDMELLRDIKSGRITLEMIEEDHRQWASGDAR